MLVPWHLTSPNVHTQVVLPFYLFVCLFACCFYVKNMHTNVLLEMVRKETARADEGTVLNVILVRLMKESESFPDWLSSKTLITLENQSCASLSAQERTSTIYRGECKTRESSVHWWTLVVCWLTN